MKRFSRYVYLIGFAVAAFSLLGFLHQFTQSAGNVTAYYIPLDSSVKIQEDGTQTHWDYAQETPEISGVYQFTGKLPPDLSNGKLVLDISGMEITLSLNGQTIYTSSMPTDNGSTGFSTVHIPISPGTSGELTLTCRVLSEAYGIFPPMVRFVDTGQELSQTIAYTNLVSFPTGAYFLAVLLVLAFFLIRLYANAPDWSMIPLMLGLLGLCCSQLVRAQEYYFLPEWSVELLEKRAVMYLSCILLLVYLLMNRRKNYLKYFFYALLGTIFALVICYGISRLSNGYFASYIHNQLSSLSTLNLSGVMYWAALWLCLVVVLISGYSVFCFFTDQTVQAQSLQYQNHVLSNSYHALEYRISESAAVQHELNHNLTSMLCMCRSGDHAGLESLLEKMLHDQKNLPRSVFTGNHTINIILQDAAAKAHRSGIRFQATVEVPEKLNIPDNDLCALLMNLLENALEAASQLPPEKSFVTIRIKTVEPYLAVKCENAFTGQLRTDSQSNLLTTKEDPLCHGFGWRQMKQIAHKYHGSLLFHHTDDGVFTLQTALRIPDQ